MTDQQPLLEVKDLKKYFPIKSGVLQRTTANVKAVENVSLQVHEGETLGIVGESGCGKSTFGRSVLGLEDITDGTIEFRGDHIEGLSKRKLKEYKKDMQMIFQDPFASLNPRQRIGDALEEVFVIHSSLSKADRQKRVRELLVEVGLQEDHYNRYPHEFSGGQRQRIGIARAIALNPSLIVCDEAVSALDVSVQAQIIRLLIDLQKRYQLTYMFISHDLGVVKHMCDRVLVMYLGTMVELGSSDQIYKNPLHPYTRALLSAIPRPIPGRKKERIKLEGDLPSASNYPTGCPFHTRCPLAQEHCKTVVPEWREVEEGHFIACHEV
ncbi:peptide/nickel transport system ATP-binding protein/oligopeptide transport system ATP-binding protein [Virgibacillus subterraneus]|uniref:Peptide/nickel transport system ATP-binding protein/oligopeptide transport system ATP-binding protein n=2 Tax=Virgibacillus TaxID=84406 RepID=A0A1H0YRM7_9BACI|nr:MULTISPECIES: dipeptide ABC transporter ATP-binding protein [Virgibacillus]SDQ17824.1 peptide/nickel transport system ATP-binding protein/oligopeptide transport system ATP-binding protein [Virgibacillus salinus]SEP80205.1 peptide/nickel transport system ATP-binding protein/oligopeptide transport system ATP-binding protein [Virgibacillus subterraneus]